MTHPTNARGPLFSRSEKLLLWLGVVSLLLLIVSSAELPGKWWDPVSALAAAAAAGFAGWQIYTTRTETRRRAAFDHIREVVNSVKPLWHYDTIVLQKGLLAFYRRESEKLPEGSAQYMAFLGAADLLAFAVEKNS